MKLEKTLSIGEVIVNKTANAGGFEIYRPAKSKDDDVTLYFFKQGSDALAFTMRVQATGTSGEGDYGYISKLEINDTAVINNETY